MTRSTLLTLVLLSFCSTVHARLVGTAPANPDVVCFGGGASAAVATNEICLDYSGNWIPTTTDVQALGSSSLEWNSANIKTLTQTGSNTSGTAGTGTLLTAGAAATQVKVLGLFATTSVTLGASGQNTGVNISTTIPVVSSYELIISSGGNILLTSKPTISTTTLVGGTVGIPDGTYLVIGSTDTNTITFQSNGALSGSQLKLGAASRAVTQYKDLTLRFSSVDSFWHEVAYSSDAN